MSFSPYKMSSINVIITLTRLGFYGIILDIIVCVPRRAAGYVPTGIPLGSWLTG